MDERVVVVGAGPAGLAVAWAIRRAGADPLIVEKAASWRARHDQLRLNTHRMFSHQPGLRIPRRYGPFPARDDYVAYLEQYAAGMRVKFGTAVGRIDRASAYPTTGDYWLTASGIPFVVALLATTAGIHNLHRGRDGLPGRAGVILTGAAMTGSSSPLPPG
jgi:cation diffusion facilitator CzcD-associated flavoprotein CzcO